MKHTPGPWAVIESPRGYIVAARDGVYDIAVIRDIGSEDNHANARLIACAPEMLEALDKIACFAPGNGDVCEIIAKVARAAIAKAEGA
jgi:hypothetical protein